MDLSELLRDIEKLEGLCLPSIRPGAEIVVESVNKEQGKIVVRSAIGKVFNRSITEFERIWEELVTEPAVRVEEVLHGSGSSRNQPETIFANLPYVEWLKINNKKHISFVGKSTHPFGTIKKMDELSASAIKDLYFQSGLSEITTLIVTKNLYKTATFVSTLSGTKPLSINEGTYLFTKGGKSIALVEAIKYGIPEGTYGFLYGFQKIKGNYSVTINGKKYGIIRDDFVNVFFLKRE